MSQQWEAETEIRRKGKRREEEEGKDELMLVIQKGFRESGESRGGNERKSKRAFFEETKVLLSVETILRD